MNPQEKQAFEERLYQFYIQVKDHKINLFIPPLPQETIDKFIELKKKLGIKDTI